MGIVRNLFDGLSNALTGAGTSVDPRMYNAYHARVMTSAEIEQAYRGSWVCRKIIDKPAEEMVREWRDWQADALDIEALEEEEKRLDIRNKVRKAETLRGLGGAGMILWVKGDNQETPVDSGRVAKAGLSAVHVWHSSKFSLGEMIADWEDPWFGYPSYYEINLGGTRRKFHPSRVAAFRGKPLPELSGSSWSSWFWGESTVQVVLDAVQNVDTAQNGFAALIKDARNRRLSVPGLTARLATGPGEAGFTKRVQALAMGESMFGVTFLDSGGPDGKGGEVLEDRQMAWGGIPEIAAMYMTAAAAAADMPATVLLGKSPDGMNATGDGDLKVWHATVKARQDLDLRPCLAQIDAVLVPSALGIVPKDLWWDFSPLSTPSEKEKADTAYVKAQTIQIYATNTLVPTIALEKGVQNMLVEDGLMPGLDSALGEMPEDERFPSLSAEPVDPNSSENATEGGDPASAGETGANGSVPVRRAANDALTILRDAGIEGDLLDQLQAIAGAE